MGAAADEIHAFEVFEAVARTQVQHLLESVSQIESRAHVDRVAIAPVIRSDHVLELDSLPNILDAHLGEAVEHQQDHVPGLAKLMLGQAAGGDVWREESWGKRKLAYQINKLSEGSYMLFHIRSDHGGVFTEVEQRMRQNERVLRYLTIRTNAGRLRHRAAKEGDPVEVSETEATQTTAEEAS